MDFSRVLSLLGIKYYLGSFLRELNGCKFTNIMYVHVFPEMDDMFIIYSIELEHLLMGNGIWSMNNWFNLSLDVIATF